MIDLIAELVPFAVVVALSPIPIIAVLLMLATPGGLGRGALFALTRIVTLALLVLALSFATDAVDDAAGSTTPAAVLRIALGATLVVAAVVKWRRRPRDGAAEALPRWMGAMDSLSAAGAVRLGAILTIANPKELAMAAGAGLTLGGAMADAVTVLVAGAVFVLLATLATTIPVVALAVGRARVAPALESARAWFVGNNATIMVIVLLVLGALLVGGGIEDLA